VCQGNVGEIEGAWRDGVFCDRLGREDEVMD
jgi:hypothetical protein